MSHVDKKNKVVGWSLSLKMSSGQTIEAVNVPNFTAAAIDDYCTEIDEGKIELGAVEMKMTPSGYYYKSYEGIQETTSNDSIKNEPLLGHGIAPIYSPTSDAPGKDNPTSGSHLHAPGSYETESGITTDNAFTVSIDEDDGYED